MPAFGDNSAAALVGKAMRRELESGKAREFRSNFTHHISIAESVANNSSNEKGHHFLPVINLGGLRKKGSRLPRDAKDDFQVLTVEQTGQINPLLSYKL